MGDPFPYYVPGQRYFTGDYRATDKSINENERNNYYYYFKEQIDIYGVQTDYFVLNYQLSAHDGLYGEQPNATYLASKSVVMYVELSEQSVLLNQFGILGDDDVTAIDDSVIDEDNQIHATVEVSTEVETTNESQDVLESIEEPTAAEKSVLSTEVEATGEMSDGIDTEFERLLLEMEGARFSSERKALMEKQTSEFLVTIKIDKMERTLLGDPKYRGGQSVHGLLDGGPYIGVVKVPVELDEKILSFKQGDDIQLWASLVDFSPSLKRPVLESSEIV